MEKKKPVQLNQPRVDPTAMSALVIGVIWNILEQNKPQTSQNKQKSLQWIVYIHLIISSIIHSFNILNISCHTNPYKSHYPNHGLLRNFLGFRRFHESPQHRTNQLRLDLTSHEFEVQLVHCWLVGSLVKTLMTFHYIGSWLVLA